MPHSTAATSQNQASTNGYGSTLTEIDEGGDLLGGLGALLAGAKVEAADAMTAGKVQPLIELVATYQGLARQAGLEALTRLIGYLPTEERQRLKLAGLCPREADVAAFLAQCPPPPGAPKFKRLSLTELRAMPAKQWQIEQVIGAGDVGMLYGAPGTGKTFAVIDLALSACTGRQWATRFDVAKPLTVAYCAGEGVSGLPQRFDAACAHYGIDDLPNFHFYAAAPQLFTADLGEYTEASIGDFMREWQTRQAAGDVDRLDLLIVDTLHSATTGADENSAMDMGKVLRGVKAATSALGCSVLLVHHTNKAGTGERGSSAMRGAMDVMIEVKTSSSKFSLNCEKLKDGQQWKAQTFDLVAINESVRVWWDEVQSLDATTGKQQQQVKELTDRLKSARGTRYTANSLAEAIGIGGSKQIFKLLPIAIDADPGIKCGLKYSDRDASPTNPTMYWYASEDSNSESLLVT